MNLAILALQNIPPAPGDAPAAATTQSAPPSGPSAPEPSPLMSAFPLLLLIPLVLFMVFSSRSQQKKQQTALAELKKGDRVLVQSGLVGKLVEMGDRYAKLEIAPGVKVDVLKSALLGKDNAESAAVLEKK